MTALQKKADNQIAHLTPEDIEQLGIELDAIRQSVLDTRGESDAAYIRKLIDVHRKLELASRAVLLAVGRARSTPPIVSASDGRPTVELPPRSGVVLRLV